MMLTLIDPKAGTHFDNVNIFVTTHAKENGMKRLRLKESEVEKSLTARLRNAALVDNSYVGDDGKEVRLFVNGALNFIVAKDAPTLITLIPTKTNDRLRAEFNKLAKRIIRKEQKTEASELLRLNRSRADVNLELARIEHAIAHGAGKTAIRKLTEQAAELRAELERIDNEIMTIKRAKASVLKNVCAYVM